jgi:hypothetical protein
MKYSLGPRVTEGAPNDQISFLELKPFFAKIFIRINPKRSIRKSQLYSGTIEHSSADTLPVFIIFKRK